MNHAREPFAETRDDHDLTSSDVRASERKPNVRRTSLKYWSLGERVVISPGYARIASICTQRGQWLSKSPYEQLTSSVVGT